jgi:hypothetical protein
MISTRSRPGKVALAFLAVLVVGVLPAAGRAETITFRNDLNIPVVVQAVSAVGRVPRRDRPYTLAPGDATPGITLPGNKVVTIYDARNPNRVVYQGFIGESPADGNYSVAPDGAGGVKFEPRAP